MSHQSATFAAKLCMWEFGKLAKAALKSLTKWLEHTNVHKMQKFVLLPDGYNSSWSTWLMSGKIFVVLVCVLTENYVGFCLKIIIDPFYFEIFYVSPFSGLFGLIQHFSLPAKEVFLLCPR